MPNPVPIDAMELVPESFCVINARKIETPNGLPCQVEVTLDVVVNGGNQEIRIIVEPGLLARMGYENPTAAFNTGFNRIPDLQYGEPVLQGVQDWMAGFTNPNILTQMICDAVI